MAQTPKRRPIVLLQCTVQLEATGHLFRFKRQHWFESGNERDGALGALPVLP